ncbi:amino acid/amide ABC transporter substrate-binding protein, HAAT family [Limimonas halophila]|uniref:Amino acid/amide ABC transporter substrate-binding protein, HAAT family n=1 Tax=Limimonas halophila TaxID=1082479 RepID=A0A1G7NHZ4_9PROT|nr:ABC transporter substrate-binding protein [Limimonas halophila]SDF72860.1 amino acid/amide ABC transporter substrate-binding protein, HAAT family [Limimonas halophila]
MVGSRWGARLLTVLAVMVAAAAGATLPVRAESEPIVLAVVGPMSGDDAASGRAIRDAAKLYASQVNARGGINGRKVRIKTFDNQHDTSLARQRARQIATESNAVAAIGHYYSSNSIAAGDIYAEHGIPVVTGSATAPGVTRDNPWYYRVIADNSMKGRLTAQYLRSFMDVDTVHIAYEEDAYGRTLHSSLREMAPKVGIEVGKRWGIDSKHDDVRARVDTIAEKLADAGDDEAIFLGLLDKQSAMLVKALRDAGSGVKILGGDSVGLGTFPDEMAAMTESEDAAADYIEGIHATTYFIPDVGNRAARRFVDTFEKRYGRKPDALAATYYDATAIALEAYRRAEPSGDLPDRRAAVRESLARFDGPAEAFHGVTGTIRFDEQGNAVRSAPFGVYRQGKLISAAGQLTPVGNPEAVLNLQDQIKSGDIVRVGDQLLYETAVVYTGLDLNSITAIDQQTGTFQADFYIWFRHTAPLDYDKIVFPNAVDSVKLGEKPLMSGMTESGYYSAYRVVATFEHDFEFQAYPFDQQKLKIRIRHQDKPLEKLIFVADEIGMNPEKNPGSEGLAVNSGPRLGDSEWHLRDVLVYSNVRKTESTLGNPRTIAAASNQSLSFSRFNVQTEVARNSNSYLLKNMVPLTLFVLVGYCTMFIRPEGPPFAARVTVGVTALLTTVFYSQRSQSDLPDIGYLVAIDYIYYAVYLYFLYAIAMTVAEHVFIMRDRKERAMRMSAFSKRFMPVMILGIGGLALALYA